jgi:uncharacterized C2H2 Zn-finger protein
LSSKFDLEFPYEEDWDDGYLVINPEGRRTVILVSKCGARSSTSYARYLVSVSLKRYLTKDEQVDHIDDDKTNDELSNLQILSPSDNHRKESRRRGRLMSKIKCPQCGRVFYKRKGQTQATKAFKGKVTCCTKECSYLFKKANSNLSKEDRLKISENSLIEVVRSHEEV